MNQALLPHALQEGRLRRFTITQGAPTAHFTCAATGLSGSPYVLTRSAGGQGPLVATTTFARRESGVFESPQLHQTQR